MKHNFKCPVKTFFFFSLSMFVKGLRNQIESFLFDILFICFLNVKHCTRRIAHRLARTKFKVKAGKQECAKIVSTTYEKNLCPGTLCLTSIKICIFVNSKLNQKTLGLHQLKNLYIVTLLKGGSNLLDSAELHI